MKATNPNTGWKVVEDLQPICEFQGDREFATKTAQVALNEP